MGFVDFLLLVCVVWFIDKIIPRHRKPMKEESREYLAGYYQDKGVRKF